MSFFGYIIYATNRDIAICLDMPPTWAPARGKGAVAPPPGIIFARSLSAGSIKVTFLLTQGISGIKKRLKRLKTISFISTVSNTHKTLHLHTQTNENKND